MTNESVQTSNSHPPLSSTPASVSGVSGADDPLNPSRSLRDSPQTLVDLLKKQGVLFLTAFSLYGILFWPVLRQWFEDCRAMEDFSHCLLIPAISAGLIYWKRKAWLSMAVSRGILGLMVFIFSLPVYFSGLGHSYNVFQRAGAYGTFVGLAGFLFGTRFLLRQLFPLFYLGLAIPIPFEIYQGLAIKLRGIATALSASFLQLLGVPALNEGNILRFGDMALNVVDACSGIRSFMAILSVAILFCYLFTTGWLGSSLLLAISLPIIVICSIFRIVIQAFFLHYWNIDFTHGASHDILGMAAFALSLALLYLAWIFFRWVLNQNEPV